MNENDETDVATARQSYRPRLSYYHPTAKNTGSAIQFELHPAHENTGGSVFASIAAQKSAGSRPGPAGGATAFPSFDWKGKICVKLDISDLSHMLSVFRGERESIMDGRGLFHKSAAATTSIRLEHRLEPVPGYAFDVSRKGESGDLRRIGFFFSPAEASALMLAIEQSMGVIAFGIPAVLPRGRRTDQAEDGFTMQECADGIRETA